MKEGLRDLIESLEWSLWKVLRNTAKYTGRWREAARENTAE